MVLTIDLVIPQYSGISTTMVNILIATLMACSCGLHGAHLGPAGPRLAQRWPHDPCYLGKLSTNEDIFIGFNENTSHVFFNDAGLLDSDLEELKKKKTEINTLRTEYITYMPLWIGPPLITCSVSRNYLNHCSFIFHSQMQKPLNRPQLGISV